MLFPENMLSDWQKFIFIQVLHNIRANHAEVTCMIHKRYSSVIASQTPISFLVEGTLFASDHSFGISPVSIDYWKR